MRPTIIVAGCTRSGMTMTMQMLHAGGVPVQGEFPAFEPFDMGTTPWGQVQGTAVKLVDAHLHFPPPDKRPGYRVILTTRNIVQQSQSMAKFLRAAGFQLSIDLKSLQRSLARDNAKIRQWAEQQESMLHLPFEDTLKAPDSTARKILDFIGPEFSLDTGRAAAVVVKRSPQCYPGMLEQRWL